MLNICLVYISIHLDIGLLWCFLKPFLAFGTCVGPVSASFMFVITRACTSTCSCFHARGPILLFAGLPIYRIELCLQAKWRDSKQPLSLMVPGQKPAVLLLRMPLTGA